MYFMHEEQLLDGVALINSVSCPTQEDCQMEEDREQVLQLSCDDEDEVSHHSTTSHTSAHPSPTLAQTVKPRNHQRVSKLSPTISKTNVKKTWETLISVEDQLFQAHFIGLLESTHSMMERMSQAILTEQYGRLKTYERQLLQVLEEVEFGLEEYQRQKKSMLGQIFQLKSENNYLKQTINHLHTTIQEIQKEVKEYFDKYALNKYISKERSIPVPFARTFSHSIEEMTKIKFDRDQEASISLSQFQAFLLDLKRDSENIIFGKQFKSCLLSNPICLSLGKDSCAWNWISEIVNNFQGISARQTKTCFRTPQPVQNREKIIEVFLNRLSHSRDHFITIISTSSEPLLCLWHILHSSLVTFLGILINETIQCPLELSFGDSTRTWTRIFLEEIKILLEESHLDLKEDEKRYLDGIQRLTWSVHELVSFRMLRNDSP